MYPKRTKTSSLEASQDEMKHYIATKQGTSKDIPSSSTQVESKSSATKSALDSSPQRPATSGMLLRAAEPKSTGGRFQPLLAPLREPPIAPTQQLSSEQQTGFSLAHMLPAANKAQMVWQDRIHTYRDAAALIDRACNQLEEVPFTPWMQSTLAALESQLRTLEGPKRLIPNDQRTDFRYSDDDNNLRGQSPIDRRTVFPSHPASAALQSKNVATSPLGNGLKGARALAKLTNQHNLAWEQDESSDVTQRPHPLRSAVAVAVLQRLFVSFNLPTSLWRDVLALVFDSNCANDVLSRDFSGSNSVAGYLERRFLCDTVKRLEAERIDLATLNHVAVGQLNQLHDYTLLEKKVADGARLRMTFAAWRSLKYLNAWKKIAMKLRLDRRSTMWIRRCFDAWRGFVVIEQLHAEVEAEKKAAREIIVNSQHQIEEGQNALRQQLLEERKEHERQLNEIKSKKVMSEDALKEIEQLREMVTTYKQDQRSYERRVKDLELIVKEQAQNAQLAEERSRRCLHALKRTALLMVGTRIMNGVKASDIIINARGIGTSSQFRFSSNDGVDTITAAANLPSPALSAGLMQQNMLMKKRYSSVVTGNSATFTNFGGEGTTSVGGGNATSNYVPTLLGMPRVNSHVGSLEMSSIVAASTALTSGVNLTSVLCSFVNGVIQRHKEQQRDATSPRSMTSMLSTPASPLSKSKSMLASAMNNNAALLFPGITNLTAAFADGRYYVQLIEIIFGPTCPLFIALQSLIGEGGSGTAESTTSQPPPTFHQSSQGAAFVRSQVSISDFSKHSNGIEIPSSPSMGVGTVRSALAVEQIYTLIILHLDETIRHYAQLTAKVRQKEVVKELMRHASTATEDGKSSSPPDIFSEEEDVLLKANEVVFSNVNEDTLPPQALEQNISSHTGIAADLINETLQGANNFIPSVTGIPASSTSLPRLGDLHARLLETPFVVRDFTEASRPLHAAAHYYLIVCFLKCYAATKMIPLPQWRPELFSRETPSHTIPIDVSSLPSMIKAHPGPPRDAQYLLLKEQEKQLFGDKKAIFHDEDENEPENTTEDSHPTSLQSPTQTPRNVLDATTAADALSTCVVLAQSSINAWSVLAQYVQEAYFFSFKSVFVLAGVPIVKIISGLENIGNSVPLEGSSSRSPHLLSTQIDNPLRAATATVAEHSHSIESSDAESTADTATSDLLGVGSPTKKSKRTKRRASFVPDVDLTFTPNSRARLRPARGSTVAFSDGTSGLVSGQNGGDLTHIQDRHTFGHTLEYVSLMKNACLNWCEEQTDREAIEMGTISASMSAGARRFLFSPNAVLASMKSKRPSEGMMAPLAALVPSSRTVDAFQDMGQGAGGSGALNGGSLSLTAQGYANVHPSGNSLVEGPSAEASATRTMLEILFAKSNAHSAKLQIETFVCYDLPLSAAMLDSIFTFALGIPPQPTGLPPNTNHRTSLLTAAATVANVPPAAPSAAATAENAILPHRQWVLLLNALNYFGLVPVATDDGRKSIKPKSMIHSTTPEMILLRQSLDAVSKTFSAFSPREGLTVREFALAMMHVAINHFGGIITDSNGFLSAPRRGSDGNNQNPFLVSSSPSHSQNSKSPQMQDLNRRNSLAFMSRSKSITLTSDPTARFTGDMALSGSLSEINETHSPAGVAGTQYKVPKPSELLLFVFLQTKVMPLLEAGAPLFTVGQNVQVTDTRLQLRALKNASANSLSTSAGGSPISSMPNWAWVSLGLGAEMPSAPLSITELHHIFSQFRYDLKPLWEKYSNDGVSLVLALAKSSGSSLAQMSSGSLLLGGNPTKKGGGHVSSATLKGSNTLPPSGSSFDLKSRPSNAHLFGTLPQSPHDSTFGVGSAAVQFYNTANQFSAFIDSAMSPMALWAHQAKVQAAALEREVITLGKSDGDDDSPSASGITIEGGDILGKQSSKKTSKRGATSSLLASMSSAMPLQPLGRNEEWVVAIMASKSKGHVTMADNSKGNKGEKDAKSPQAGSDLQNGRKSPTSVSASAFTPTSGSNLAKGAPLVGVLSSSPAGHYSGISHAVAAFLAFVKKESTAAEAVMSSFASPINNGQGSGTDLAAGGASPIARTSSIANSAVKRTSSNTNTQSANNVAALQAASSPQVGGYAATLRRPDVIRSIITSVAASIVSRDIPRPVFHVGTDTIAKTSPPTVKDLVAEADEAAFRLRQDSFQFEAFCDMCVLLAMTIWPSPMYRDVARLKLFISVFTANVKLQQQQH